MTGAAKVRHIAPGYAELVGYFLLGKPSGVVQPEHEFPIVRGKPSGVHCRGRARNVRPGLSGHDGADRSLSKAIVGTNRLLCLTIRAPLPDNHNIRFGELSLRMKGAWTWSTVRLVPALVDAILHVISLRSYDEMCRIDAGWIVASMKSILTLRNRAIGKLVGYAMGKHVFLTDPDYPVTLVVLGTSPGPTRVGLENL